MVYARQTSVHNHVLDCLFSVLNKQLFQ